MLFAFRTFARLMGARAGYLGGYIVYWIIWCGAVPLWILGGNGILNLFRNPSSPFGQPALMGILFLALPVLLVLFTVFPQLVRQVTVPIVIFSALLALVNGVAEEILWRGLYANVFAHHFLFGYLYPALGFAVWHFAPQSIYQREQPGGTAAFVWGALFVGLCWGWVAWSTESILWTTASHVIMDFLGFGALIYSRN